LLTNNQMARIFRLNLSVVVEAATAAVGTGAVAEDTLAAVGTAVEEVDMSAEELQVAILTFIKKQSR
jgi:hypothetical protein